jgi:hypothetical protein
LIRLAGSKKKVKIQMATAQSVAVFKHIFQGAQPGMYVSNLEHPFKFAVDLSPWLSSVEGRGNEKKRSDFVRIKRLSVSSYSNTTENLWALRILGHPALASFSHTMVNGENPDDLILEVLSPCTNGKGSTPLHKPELDESVLVDVTKALLVEVREMTSLFDVGTPLFELRFFVELVFEDDDSESSEGDLESAEEG